MSLKIEPQRKQAFLKWMKRIGVWGFIFFLLKGLVWLAIGYWFIK